MYDYGRFRLCFFISVCLICHLWENLSEHVYLSVRLSFRLSLAILYYVLLANFCTYSDDQLRWEICFSGSPSLYCILFCWHLLLCCCTDGLINWLIDWLTQRQIRGGGSPDETSKLISPRGVGGPGPSSTQIDAQSLDPGWPPGEGGGRRTQNQNCLEFYKEFKNVNKTYFQSPQLPKNRKFPKMAEKVPKTENAKLYWKTGLYKNYAFNVTSAV